MCEECINGSVIGGFDHCRRTDKYPYTHCKHFEPDPLFNDKFYHMDMDAWEMYPQWNKTLKQE